MTKEQDTFKTYLLSQILSWVGRCFYSTVPQSTRTHSINYCVSKFVTWSRTRGLVWTADTVKLHRLALTRYLAGTPLARPSGISLTSDGLPKFIPHELREAVRARDPRSISWALTLLSLSRGILGGKPVDIKAIEDPPSILETKNVLRYLDDFLSHYGIGKLDTRWQGFHWSTKAAPSGPSLVSALGSWRFLPNSLKEDHITIAGDTLRDIYEEYAKWSDDVWSTLLKLYPCKRNLIRKLAVKADREGKSRVFALLDYYSQAVLRPIHLGLFQGLRKIPSDRTFVQAGGGINLTPSSNYYSFDLSSATDRFPLIIQKELISRLTDAKLANAWADILTQHGYDLNGKTVFYNTGQPMGAYSSWAAFTMAHHLVVYAAARLSDKTDFSNYVILGDDIVIADDKVAENYRLLIGQLGVPISETKSHISKDIFEFAKRWFLNGQEVTPFPIHGLMEVWKRYYLLLELFRQVRDRGFGDSVFSIRNPSQLPELLRIFGLKGRLLHQIVWKFKVAACIPLAGATPHEVYECAKAFAQLTGVWLSCNLRLAEVVRIFERHAAETITSMLAREAENITKKVQSWHKAMFEAFNNDSFQRSVDQTELLDRQAELLPVLSALSERAWDALDRVGPDNITGVAGNSIWDKHARLELLAMPDVQGINPVRASHQRAGSRATWAHRLVVKWKLHDLGRRLL